VSYQWKKMISFIEKKNTERKKEEKQGISQQPLKG
jgi:hypothetical protein